MPTDWIMVRISRETHARLEEARLSMLLGHEMGLRSLDSDDRDRVSLNQIIHILLDSRDKHAVRRKRSAATRKHRRSIAAEFARETSATGPD